METALVCVFGSLVALLIILAVSKRRQVRFEERFPPISDEEFVARCSPGTRPEVALRVRRVVADSFGVEYERVYPSSRLVEDLEAD